MITIEDAVVYEVGNATSGPFSAELEFDAASELNGIYQRTDNVVGTLTVDSADPIAKTVTFTTSVPSSAILAIYRVTQQTQSTEFRRHGSFEAKKHDDAIDKVYKILQELGDSGVRGLMISPADKGIDTVVHYDLSQQSGNALRLNAAGDGFDFIEGAATLASASQDADAAEASETAAAISALGSAEAAANAETYTDTAVAGLATLQDISDLVGVDVVDLGTAGGTASAGKTYLVDTSSGPVTVALNDPQPVDSELRIKSVSPCLQKLTVSSTGGLEGYSSINLWHPGQGISLARSVSGWSIVSESNDFASIEFPKLVYNDDDNIDVSAKHGRPAFISCILQDGKVHHYDGGSLTVDLDVSGDLGLDTGSRANSTWYYVYLVPDTSAWRTLTAVCSVSDPDTGPTGYDQFVYVGAFKTDSSGDIISFVQHGNKFWIKHLDDQDLVVRCSGSSIVGGGAMTDDVWAATTGTNLTPATYSGALMGGQMDNDAGYGFVQMSASIDGGAPPWSSPTNVFPDSRNDLGGQTGDGSATQKWIRSTKATYYYVAKFDSSGATDFSYVLCGWADGYIPT